MKVMGDLFALLTLLIGVAIVAVLVSNRAKTAEVIGAFASGLSQLLATVVSPVTGSKQDNPFQ
jgi:hypothetical protein